MPWEQCNKLGHRSNFVLVHTVVLPDLNVITHTKPWKALPLLGGVPWQEFFIQISQQTPDDKRSSRKIIARHLSLWPLGWVSPQTEIILGSVLGIPLAEIIDKLDPNILLRLQGLHSYPHSLLHNEFYTATVAGQTLDRVVSRSKSFHGTSPTRTKDDLTGETAE